MLIKQWIASRTAASLILTRHRIRPTRTVACMAGINSTVAIPSLPQPQLSTVASEFVSLRRWIHVLNFHEGIASWRESLAELLYLAHTYKATLVEPCMKNGRLMSCARLPSSGRVHLSQVLDFRHLQKTYGSSIIASHRLFDEEANGSNLTARVYNTCFASNAQKQSLCDNSTAYDDIFNWVDYEDRPAIVSWASDNPFGDEAESRRVAILEVSSVRKWRLSRWIPINDFFFFHQHHWDLVTCTLEQQLPISGKGFSIIHWRGEKKDMNYTVCAEYILEAIGMLRNEHKRRTHPFFLMSSLKVERERMWGGAKTLANLAGEDPKRALEMLLHNKTMFSLELLLENAGIVPADSGLLAVWDLILVAKSTEFSTCTRGCDQRCLACNHVGNFARMAMQYYSSRKRSRLYECWPMRS